jgi:hypothetical protein
MLLRHRRARRALGRQIITKQCCPMTVYVCGAANAHYVRRRGVEPIVLSDDPFPNIFPNPYGLEQSHWNIKLAMLRDAIQRHGAVVWLDADIKVLNPIPENFAESLAHGQPIRAPVRYINNFCGFRLTGGCLYVRGMEAMEAIWTVARENPDKDDQWVVFFTILQYLQQRGYPNLLWFLRNINLPCYASSRTISTDWNRPIFWHR